MSDTSRRDRRASVGRRPLLSEEERRTLGIREQGRLIAARSRNSWLGDVGWGVLMLPVMALIVLGTLGVLGVGAKVLVGLARLAGG